jgi:hypothetical protein
MKMRWLAFAFLLLGLAPHALAQVTTVSAVDPALSQTWTENEGLWRGVWVPVRPGSSAGAYSATWSMLGHSDRTGANLTISIHGDHVDIARHNRDGTCGYQGTFSADRKSVSGTYSCNGGPALHWIAFVGAQHDSQTAPYDHTGLPPLHYTWLEREGDWRGTWIPYNPQSGNGAYEGTWLQPPHTGSVAAQLSITLNQYDVTVHRTQREGSCTYTGHLSYDQRTVSGTYVCDWHPAPLPWSAQIQLPR